MSKLVQQHAKILRKSKDYLQVLWTTTVLDVIGCSYSVHVSQLK